MLNLLAETIIPSVANHAIRSQNITPCNIYNRNVRLRRLHRVDDHSLNATIPTEVGLNDKFMITRLERAFPRGCRKVIGRHITAIEDKHVTLSIVRLGGRRYESDRVRLTNRELVVVINYVLTLRIDGLNRNLLKLTEPPIGRRDFASAIVNNEANGMPRLRRLHIEEERGETRRARLVGSRDLRVVRAYGILTDTIAVGLNGLTVIDNRNQVTVHIETEVVVMTDLELGRVDHIIRDRQEVVFELLVGLWLSMVVKLLLIGRVDNAKVCRLAARQEILNVDNQADWRTCLGMGLDNSIAQIDHSTPSITKVKS